MGAFEEDSAPSIHSKGLHGWEEGWLHFVDQPTKQYARIKIKSSVISVFVAERDELILLRKLQTITGWGGSVMFDC